MLLTSSFFVLPYISPVHHSPRCEKKRSHPGETWEPIYKVEENIKENFKRLRSRYRQFRGWQIEEPQLLPCTDSRGKPSSKVLRSAVARSPMAPDLPSPHLIKPNTQIVILSIFRTTTAHSHKKMLCNISTHNNSQKQNKRSCTIHLLLLTLNPSWTITTLCTLLTQNQRRPHGFFYETCTKNNAAAAVCVCVWSVNSKQNKCQLHHPAKGFCTRRLQAFLGLVHKQLGWGMCLTHPYVSPSLGFFFNATLVFSLRWSIYTSSSPLLARFASLSPPAASRGNKEAARGNNETR